MGENPMRYEFNPEEIDLLMFLVENRICELEPMMKDVQNNVQYDNMNQELNLLNGTISVLTVISEER